MIRKNSGFTLAELMVVIAIISILSAIAVPNFIGWLAKRKVGTGARDVLSTIEVARIRAVRQRISVGIEFQADNMSYRVWLDDGSGGGGIADDASLNGTERIILNNRLPAGITATWARFPKGSAQRRFRFDSTGFPLDTSGNPADGEIRITNNQGDDRDIDLSVSGNVIILKP
jgi:type IV fimbrial biogenesis protein FimT